MRVRVLLTMAVVAAIATMPAARADFHQPACGGVGGASVNLDVHDGVFVFTGRVTCQSTATLEILELTLTPQNGPTVSAPANSCTQTCTTSGDTPATAGLTTVFMRFRVTSDQGDVFEKDRVGQWVWAGAGDPVRTPCSTSGSPPLNGCV